ncbi:50S ribosomal protein L3 N(5)-glutamine methyltransferase [Candidatus Berkiella cookevillensis]|uniref:Ribosomal protein uL3 glutamine methyltransferase n=1 Tax=Candidatus Berkiella cookevillensis TaxID=437022 RepID=A0A0Q9YFI7_9GAMM|nr:50S ribosomal protein L3 N(5)-glutamine methyltransferase [Candidatus Berkiella cookevillensis]MCS5708922.1 50S ribosomal protein L3 N(5)-glutamine methyltransferase [Candidatus Berkiella cookevillensis]
MATEVEMKEAQDEMITTRDLIRWAVSQFNKENLVYGHGTDNAWDEAVNLILSSVHLPPDIDVNVLDAKLSYSERVCIVERIQKRVVDRIPVAYLVKEAWFAGLNFYVDERVLIPRSPIAELIEDEFSPWVEETHVESILDLGTGSGCIAIGCALTFPQAKVDAVDYSDNAIEVAKINVARFGLEDSVEVIKSDLFSELGNKQYDIIVSNPPYVSLEEYNTLPSEYHFEPEMALVSKENGLQIVKRILSQAEQHLSDSGILIVEVGYSQGYVEEAFPDIPFTWLQFENGGEGVFLLTKDELKEFKQQLSRTA